MAQELHLFIREALRTGVSRTDIQSLLSKAGWPKDEITSGLELYADLPCAIPVPRKKPSLSAREAFLYLVLFSMLYVSAFHLGRLLFHFIDLWVVDALQQDTWYRSSLDNGMRFSIASIIVTFPIFLSVAVYLSRLTARDPEKRGSGVRKWLTYLTLFIAASIIVGDLIALVSGVLIGDLPMRFMLKSFTVLAIAGGIFGYYLWDLHQAESKSV